MCASQNNRENAISPTPVKAPVASKMTMAVAASLRKLERLFEARRMAIINDYDAIARRLRVINPPAGKDDDLKAWRSRAEETPGRM